MSAQLTRNVALKATRVIGQARKSTMSTRLSAKAASRATRAIGKAPGPATSARTPAKAAPKATRPTRISPRAAKRAREFAKLVPKPPITPAVAALREASLRTGSFGSKSPLSRPRNRLQKPSPTILGPKRNRGHDHEHGKDIFVYHHLQKNMIVYSLTKAMRNNAALAQIPFNGKKTVPSALRKDLWHPFAQISFPPGHGFIGLSAYQKLREYRRRHELEWGREISRRERTKEEIKKWKEENPEKNWDEQKERDKLVKRENHGRLISDQKANSIADMAAVLNRLALDESEKPEIKIRNGRAVRPPSIGLKREGTGIEVEVLWRDVEDKGFAAEWKANVTHGELSMHTNSRTYSSRKGRSRKGGKKHKPVLSEEARSHRWRYIQEMEAAGFKVKEVIPPHVTNPYVKPPKEQRGFLSKLRTLGL